MSLWVFLRRNKQSSLDGRQLCLLLTKKWTGEIPMTRMSSLREVKYSLAWTRDIGVQVGLRSISNVMLLLCQTEWKCSMFETKPCHCWVAWQPLSHNMIDIEKLAWWRLLHHKILQVMLPPGDTLLMKTLHNSSDLDCSCQVVRVMTIRSYGQLQNYM